MHKQLCEEIEKEFQEVHLDWARGASQITSINYITGKARIHNRASQTNPNKTHDILKVQRREDKYKYLADKPVLEAKQPLSVYSQHHDIYGFINPKNPLYSRLKNNIEEEGQLGYKIYIKSCQREGKLWVNPSRILQPRTW